MIDPFVKIFIIVKIILLLSSKTQMLCINGQYRIVCNLIYLLQFLLCVGATTTSRITVLNYRKLPLKLDWKWADGLKRSPKSHTVSLNERPARKVCGLRK